MLYTGGHNINPRSIDTAVTEDVSKLGDVLLDTVECSGEEFAQIVGKDFAWFHAGSFAQFLHRRPNVAAVQRLTCSCNKNCAGTNTIFLSVI